MAKRKIDDTTGPDYTGIDRSPKRDWNVAKPEDLKYVGVQDTGMAMKAGKSIESRKKKMEDTMKNLDEGKSIE
jgi:hypothetical protein